MFLDVDYFKQVNDSFGHDVGDLLLKQFAHRLKNCVKKRDCLARWGGDEFVVLLVDIIASTSCKSKTYRAMDWFLRAS